MSNFQQLKNMWQSKANVQSSNVPPIKPPVQKMTKSVPATVPVVNSMPPTETTPVVASDHTKNST